VSGQPPDPRWGEVDAYLTTHLCPDDDALSHARQSSRTAGLPEIEVSAPQGALLGLLCRIIGAQRILEIGTLGGYSTITLARAVGPHGHVTTLELQPTHAQVALANLEHAGVADHVDVIVGPASDSLRKLADASTPPYDLVFIDADKASNKDYVDAALELAHPGALIVVDNVVRQGRVVEADSDSADVGGSRAVIEHVGQHPRLDATALQTVGAKGYDGFLLALVR